MHTVVNSPASVVSGSRPTRSRKLRTLLIGLPSLGLLAIAAILCTTVWRAVTLVRPPRLAVNQDVIARGLPGAERVSFRGSDDVELVGDYIAPRNGAVVVFVHGLYANREQLLPDARMLADNGYGVLIYDNRAHGDSGGSVATWGLLESGDAARAVDFVQARTNLPRSKIGLLGLSIGGTAVIREAVADDQIGAIVVEATYSSMGREIQYMYSHYGALSEWPARWTAQLLGGLDFAEIEPQDLICQLHARPVLLVYGSGDQDVPLSEGYRMSRAACRPDALVVVDAETHGGYMDSPGASMYAERLLQFFADSLRGATQAHGGGTTS